MFASLLIETLVVGWLWQMEVTSFFHILSLDISHSSVCIWSRVSVSLSNSSDRVSDAVWLPSLDSSIWVSLLFLMLSNDRIFASLFASRSGLDVGSAIWRCCSAAFCGVINLSIERFQHLLIRFSCPLFPTYLWRRVFWYNQKALYFERFRQRR